MESKMMGGAAGGFLIALALCSVLAWVSAVPAQEPSGGGQAEINLRRSAQSRQYQGREVEGEERQIAPGDTLWRILVRDKGLPEQKFRSYLVVIRGLNPQIKDPQILRVGDKIFIPLRPDQITSSRPIAEAAVERSNGGRGGTTNYRVKSGEHLYQILREQLRLTDDRKVAQYYALVKDLNPERKTWDTLNEGEIIRLPSTGQSTQVATAPAVKSPRAGESPTKEGRAAESRPGADIKSSGAGAQSTAAANLPRPAESRPTAE
ncbi:MAG TPA: LysM peptidoglycan-binding domain-containing protein, partial [Candidatus Binatia bacterium]